MSLHFCFGLGKSKVSPNPSAPSPGKENGSGEFISPSLDREKHNRENSVKGASGTACGGAVDEDVKNDIAIAGRLGIAATTLEGVLAVKGHGTPGHAGH